MKKSLKNAVATTALVAIVGMAGTAKADVTLTGETGLIINPTAEIAKKGQSEIAANFYRAWKLSGIGGSARQNDYSVVGATALSDRMELSAGIGRTDVSFTGGGAPTGNTTLTDVGLKYSIWNASQKGYDLAVGAGFQDLGMLIGQVDSKNTHVYVAATKAFGTSKKRPPIKATLGVRYDRFEAQAAGLGGNLTSNQLSVYGGADVPVTDSISVVGEIGTKFIGDISAGGGSISFNSPYALGLRYHPKDKNFSIGAGIQRSGLGTLSNTGGIGATSSNDNFFLQAGYTFGK